MISCPPIQCQSPGPARAAYTEPFSCLRHHPRPALFFFLTCLYFSIDIRLIFLTYISYHVLLFNSLQWLSINSRTESQLLDLAVKVHPQRTPTFHSNTPVGSLYLVLPLCLLTLFPSPKTLVFFPIWLVKPYFLLGQISNVRCFSDFLKIISCFPLVNFHRTLHIPTALITL